MNKNATTFLASSESYTGKRISRRRKSKSLLKMDQECELNQPEEEDRRIQEDSRSEIVVARDRNHWCVNNNKESADVVGNSPNVRYRKLSSTSTYRHDFCHCFALCARFIGTPQHARHQRSTPALP